MIPIIYETDTFPENLNTNGIGRLTDTIDCSVTEERNGDYFLSLEYPVNGARFADIVPSAIIGAKPNDETDLEWFRVDAVTATSGGSVSVFARQIALSEMKWNVVKSFNSVSGGVPFYARDVLADFWSYSMNGAGYYHTLTLSSNIGTPLTQWIVPNAVPLIEAIVGDQYSLVAKVGGELKYSGFSVSLLSSRGADSGVTIAYGKNITGLTVETDLSEVYTGILPYVPITEGWGAPGMNTGTVAINSTDSLYPFSRIKALDVSYLLGSNEGTTTPTTDDITDAGIEYIDANPDAGLPESTIKVDFVPLATTEEYKNLATLETVNLCDTAKIYYPSLGVSKSAKVVKTTYDVLNERYSAVEIGTLKQTLAQTIKNIRRSR